MDFRPGKPTNGMWHLAAAAQVLFLPCAAVWNHETGPLPFLRVGRAPNTRRGRLPRDSPDSSFFHLQGLFNKLKSSTSPTQSRVESLDRELDATQWWETSRRPVPPIPVIYRGTKFNCGTCNVIRVLIVLVDRPEIKIRSEIARFSLTRTGFCELFVWWEWLEIRFNV